MARILITGSTDGLGKLAAEKLIAAGHQVVLHARNKERADFLKSQLTSSYPILIADLSNLEETKKLTKAANDLGKFDAVIHNAGVLHADSKTIFQVNVLAPYVLTALMEKPNRLIYLSSSMHLGGKEFSEKGQLEKTTYSDSKLMITALTAAFAILYPEVRCNAVDPGWVPTKMGGKNAPDDLQKGVETQIWLATSEEKEANVSGKYFRHKQVKSPHPAVLDEAYQNRLIQWCEELSGL
ncbi:NAD(P)-dependent dehydrogenase (short-subunit alcohol dehydrogenase family) [Algoriphagus boseongensis]|uniref:NAD(P)-dependent dehydrogenase (Short-subunit alcohol dehydrogenase family) n=1 Tax=Algoriphagus boseongensis TaxID=1442587 RepID=A0A4R6T2W1_9BACT|nr:SDR family NAD(P)-dependent oxidoreductase [Algoriphagus boseongensis]TDQ15088.1 NAD(P)-dependent dehydrogenase (short-subunit alcohol dehydrogenase family) [Algoriphagus boseongensis]